MINSMNENQKLNEYISLIANFAPNLEIKKCDYCPCDEKNKTIMINDEFVFKFFDRNEIYACYEKEKIILDTIRPFISTKIPEMELFQNGKNICSIRRSIVGELYNNLSPKQKKNILENLSSDIANFMAELHSLNCEFLPIQKTSPYEFDIYKNYDNITKYLDNSIKIKDFKDTLYKFENLLKIDHGNVVCHYNLSGTNIIVDLKNNKLAGIVNFNDVIRRNYNTELILMYEEDYNLAKKIIEKYQKMTGRILDSEYIDILLKIRTYSRIGKLMSHNKTISKEYMLQLEKLNKNRGMK